MALRSLHLTMPNISFMTNIIGVLSCKHIYLNLYTAPLSTLGLLHKCYLKHILKINNRLPKPSDTSRPYFRCKEFLPPLPIVKLHYSAQPSDASVIPSINHIHTPFKKSLGKCVIVCLMACSEGHQIYNLLDQVGRRVPKPFDLYWYCIVIPLPIQEYHL